MSEGQTVLPIIGLDVNRQTNVVDCAVVLPLVVQKNYQSNRYHASSACPSATHQDNEQCVVPETGVQKS